MANPYDEEPRADHGYTVQQLDHANRWQIIKHVGTLAEANVMLDYYQRQSSATEWRIVNHVTGRVTA